MYELTADLALHFGEIVVLDANLSFYMTAVDGEDYRQSDHALLSVKDLLLKIGYGYLQLFDSKEYIDETINISFTEKELWIMRQVVTINSTWKGTPIGDELRRKIFQALLTIDDGQISNHDSWSIEDITDVPKRNR